MRIADFLYRKLGLNIFKAAATPEKHKRLRFHSRRKVEPEPLEPPTPINASHRCDSHRPQGGRYKVDSQWAQDLPQGQLKQGRPTDWKQTEFKY
jgi:hypothetical protein